MKNDEKRKFIKNLCDAIRDEVTRAVAKMPEEFDGHELRAFLAQKFEHEASDVCKGRSKRAKDFREWSAWHWSAGRLA